MALTVKQALEGFIIEDLHDRVEQVTDPIDMIANYNIEERTEDTFVRVETHDSATFEQLDAYGVLPSSAIAYVKDRVIREQVLTIPGSYEKQIRITREEFSKYGIDFGMLEISGNTASPVALGLYNNLKREVVKLVTDVMQEERDRVNKFLDEIGASSDGFVCPFNEQLAAASRTNGIWNFNNKGTAALSGTEFKVVYNAFGKQVDIKGHDVGQLVPRILLHASDSGLAEEILKPDTSKDITLRSLADLGGDIPKMAGQYKPASSSESNDWICFASYPFVQKTIRRLVSKQYSSVSIDGVTIKGWKVDIYEDKPNNRIIVSVQGKSQLVCDSPVGIYKAIVPNA